MNAGHLRFISCLEGISFLLLGLAMAARRFWGVDAVFYAGMTHGALFIAFVLVLLVACHREGFGVEVVLFGLVAAVIPFAPFVFERYVHKKEQNA